MTLSLRPISLRAANGFIAANHRHHKEARGCLFCVSVVNADGDVRGVAIVGRPVARGLQDGVTAEVTRLCTLEDKNACSMLYASAWRAARAIGYRKMVTYVLESEPATTLRAAGWRFAALTTGGSWDCKSRPRTDKAPICPKQRWEVAA